MGVGWLCSKRWNSQDIIHADIIKDENIVIVYSGESFVSKIIFYF